jgi:hypothetical protein
MVVGACRATPKCHTDNKTAIPARGKRAMNCLDGGYSGTLVTCKVYRSLPIQVCFITFPFLISFPFLSFSASFPTNLMSICFYFLFLLPLFFFFDLIFWNIKQDWRSSEFTKLFKKAYKYQPYHPLCTLTGYYRQVEA